MKTYFYLLILVNAFAGLFAQVAPSPETSYNFKTAVVGAIVYHDFEIKNSANTPLTITKVSSSCPCTQILAFPKEIKSNENGIISITTTMEPVGHKDVLIKAETSQGQIFSFEVLGEIVSRGPLPDSTIYVEPSHLVKDFSGVTFLDVRNPTDFDQAHIPNSSNHKVFSLHTKTYLKNNQLVLIGKGDEDESLRRELVLCQKAGFSKISILRGGIRQWQQAGGRLVGTSWKSPSLATLSQDVLLSDQESGSWTAFVPNDRKASLSYLPVTLQTYSDLPQLLSELDNYVTTNPEVRFIGVFVQTDQVRKTLENTPMKLNRPVFLIKGSWSQFVALTKTQVSSQNPQLVHYSSGPYSHRVTNCSTCF